MVLLFIIIFGMVIGSYINVFIDRTIIGQSTIISRSYCDYCGEKLKVYNLIPVVSYMIQRGRCSFCNEKIKIQYPIIEIICSFIFLIFYLVTDKVVTGIFLSILISFLLGMSIIDIKSKEIYIKHLVLIFILSLILSFKRYWIKFDIIIKVIFILIFLLLGYLLSKKEKAGFGDFLLISILTMNMYFNEIVLFFIILSIIGLTVGTYILLKYRDFKFKIPFVPIISMSYLIITIYITGK